MSNSSSAPSRRKFLKIAAAGVLGVAALGIGYASQIPSLQQGLTKEQKAEGQVTSLQSRLDHLSLGGYLYAFGQNAVSALDMRNNQPILSAATNFVIDNIGTHAKPDALGRIWGIHNEPGQPYPSRTKQSWILSVDPIGMNVLQQFPVGGHLNAAEPTPDGKFVIQAASGKNLANIIDTQTLQISQTLQTGNWPCDIHALPDGKFAYIPNRNDDTITEIDLNSLAVSKTLPLPKGSGPSMLTVSPDGKYIFIENSGKYSDQVGTSVSEGSPNETIIERSSGNVVKQIIFPDNGSPGVDNFTPDGRYTFVTLFGKTGGLAVIDVGTLSLVTVIPIPGAPSGIQVGPDGKYAYAGTPEGVVVVDVSSLSVDRVVKFPGGSPQIVKVAK